ncbi:MAG: TRAP transporter substrate-binding protein [Hyphomonas sp.]|jgi:TRAP-type mannitol/chloroaromatic compound transport system substrate-binding protein|uniref:TRAP-type C4-dicarboxylate transport system, periplasmic component n=1 Tax=hydrothermal vent metagenome TaxID=652676 RepID=A0A160U016_9ZZZZ|nr:TRAP transporter substrate-binding protein [Hyphomonas sp.]MDF1805054.1 TRAP transporter substrate-binding protein [Hyphomonas sp.]|tara:strand:- start:112 stop:1221 length:1110 start_codon:yes stop_codon:yes gene_type:complete
MIHRRNLLGAGALGLAGAAAAFANPEKAADLAAPAIARNRRRLNMVTTWPKGLPGLGEAAERVAQRIQQMSEGLMEVKVYAAGELVPPFECFDAVSNGSADMYHGAEYYWTAKSSAYPFFTAVPFGMTAQELMGWIDFGGGQKLWDELSAQFGIKSIQAANTGHQMGGWFRKEINTLDDLVGLKMRIPGQGGDVLRALGGSSVALPGGEIYQSLQTGAIDATEWVGPWNDYYLGFHREAPYYYGPGFHEPGASLAVGMNLRVWDGLTPGEQQIIKAACESVNHTSLGEFTYQNAVHLDLLKREHGVQMRSFPDEVVSRMAEAAWDVRAASGRDGIEKRIYESFEAGLKLMRGWADVSEGPYYAARNSNK